MRTPVKSVAFMVALAASAAPAASVYAHGHGHGHAHGHLHHHVFNALPYAGDYGAPGGIGFVSRTIEVTMADDMTARPETVTVRRGATVAFVITNASHSRQTFMLGDEPQLIASAKQIERQPDLAQRLPNVVSVEPGETKLIAWRFGSPGSVAYGSQLPGRYQADAMGKVVVVD